MAKVKPLRKRTMSLDKLQIRTLDVLRQVRRQFNRAAYEPGMSDTEFLDQVVSSLESDIQSDRVVLEMNRKKKRSAR